MLLVVGRTKFVEGLVENDVADGGGGGLRPGTEQGGAAVAKGG